MKDSVDLTAIRQRAEAATPPPWNEFGTDPGDGSYCISGRVVDPKDGHSFFPRIVSVRALGGSPNIPIYKWDKANADFIAHARTDIPYLLDRLEAAERALTTARTALEGVQWVDHLVPEDTDHPIYRICPFCEHVAGIHSPDCKRQQALIEIAAALGKEER